MVSKLTKATSTVLLTTAILTGLQLEFPSILDLFQRTPAALSGDWWRLVTPILINRSGWLDISSNMFMFTLIGVVVEQRWGSARWLIFYLTGGLVGDAVGLDWRPIGAGCWVAVCGLLGALAVWLCTRTGRWSSRILGISTLAAGILLSGLSNLYAP
jgi:membrane associated rhomboid family serine protease